MVFWGLNFCSEKCSLSQHLSSLSPFSFHTPPLSPEQGLGIVALLNRLDSVQGLLEFKINIQKLSKYLVKIILKAGVTRLLLS